MMGSALPLPPRSHDGTVITYSQQHALKEMSEATIKTNYLTGANHPGRRYCAVVLVLGIRNCAQGRPGLAVPLEHGLKVSGMRPGQPSWCPMPPWTERQCPGPGSSGIAQAALAVLWRPLQKWLASRLTSQ